MNRFQSPFFCCCCDAGRNAKSYFFLLLAAWRWWKITDSCALVESSFGRDKCFFEQIALCRAKLMFLEFWNENLANRFTFSFQLFSNWKACFSRHVHHGLSNAGCPFALDKASSKNDCPFRNIKYYSCFTLTGHSGENKWVGCPVIEVTSSNRIEPVYCGDNRLELIRHSLFLDGVRERI